MDTINLILGLISATLSAFAIWTANRASKAVVKFRKTQRQIELKHRIESAIQAAREIQDSAAARWPKGRCDTLREILAALQDESGFTKRERDPIRKAVAELRIPRENDEYSRRWIRELMDDLIRLHQHHTKELEESIT